MLFLNKIIKNINIFILYALNTVYISCERPFAYSYAQRGSFFFVAAETEVLIIRFESMVPYPFVKIFPQIIPILNERVLITIFQSAQE